MTQTSAPRDSQAIPMEHDPFAGGDLFASLSPTAPQQELWMASKVGGDNANRAFNECLVLTFRGNLNADLLAAVLQILADRHEALRCSFTNDGQRFTVLSTLQNLLVRRDVSDLPVEERERRIEALLRAEVETPFDLGRAPLFRTSLIRVAPDLHKLVFCAHHVVCDGWSAGVLIQELAALYRAGVSVWPVAPTPAQAKLGPAASFAAYASSLRERSQSPEGAADETFWIDRLSGSPKPIDLPTDRPYPPRRTYASRRLDLPLDPRLVAPLRQLGARAGCTFTVTLMGAFQMWLARLTGQHDLVVGMPAAGQAAVGASSLVGHCVHLLPIRVAVDPSNT